MTRVLALLLALTREPWSEEFKIVLAAGCGLTLGLLLGRP